MNKSLTVSIVVYEPDMEIVSKAINSVLSTSFVSKLYILDNSRFGSVRSLCFNSRAKYILNKSNLGFGAAHNIAIRQAIQQKAKYHLVLNPDMYFENEILEKLHSFMDENPDIGLVMPKILYPDGSLQYLCKLLPTPMDLIRRRFLPPLKYFKKKNISYELRFTGYNKTMDVPYLSGCFMFFRAEALNRVGLFDERYFMYLEDVDMSRRIHQHYRTVYYPHASVFHQYDKGSYKKLTLLKYHLQSALRYFNKWGYFYDKERRNINTNTLKRLKAKTKNSSYTINI